MADVMRALGEITHVNLRKGKKPDVRFALSLGDLDVFQLMTWREGPIEVTVRSLQGELPLMGDAEAPE